MLVPIILSGGTGSRLWPLSREAYPKQFLPLLGEHTLLQETALRLQGLQNVDVSTPIVVCNEAHRFMVAEQLRALAITPMSVILEPLGRNTAPAVAVAALQALQVDNDPLLMVLPADHAIKNVAVFQAALQHVIPIAETGQLLTFGVQPDNPQTGYGYIKAGSALTETVFQVEQFVEKPDLKRAQHYVASGEYFWNSGMFMFHASRYLAELEQFAPEMLAACRKAHANADRDLDFLRLSEDDFAACPSDSIDYAVMEKTASAAVYPLHDSGWTDVGSWAALWQVSEQDNAGNVSQGDVLTVDAQNCYGHSEGRLLALVGVDNIVAVETADAVLVTHKDKVQNIKRLVEQLKHADRPERIAHRKVYRPWGSYDSIDQADRFQVKRITVKSGASLSLQKHYHRAEHWIVVKGTARITRDDEVFLLTENESTFIPLGSRHRLENPGKIPLELIEVQSGSYLGEDDIVRFADVYGREDAQ